MPKRGGNLLTKMSALTILLFVLFSHFSQKQWNDEGRVITGDVKVFYAYLPAIFIHNDLPLDDPFVYGNEEGYRIFFSDNIKGKRYMRATCGMAILYSPFFFVGHVGAYLLNEPMDGFSYPYMFSLIMGTVVYLFIGLIFLGKLLRLYFEDHVVAITLLILFLGTNAYYYYTGTMLYSHGFSLTLITIFLYATIRWLKSPSLKMAAVIGVSSGLFILVRPIDILFALAIVLIGITSLEDLKVRFKLFWAKRTHVLLILGIGVLIMSPQFAYNYYISGKILFNAYSYGGEGFFFGNPHLLDVLTSYRNGWLVYSPLMLLSILGFFFLIRAKNEMTTFIIPIVLIYFFVIASWWCWWYVGFGNRAFVNLYPLLAIPLAATIAFCLKQRKIFQFGFKLLIVVGIMLSLFQVEQFRKGHIHWSDMTKQAYWDIFLQDLPSERYETYLISSVIEDQKKGIGNSFYPIVKDVYHITFDFNTPESSDSTLLEFHASSGKNGSVCASIPDGVMYIGEIAIEPKSQANELYTSAWFYGELNQKTHLTVSNSSGTFVEFAHEIIEVKNGWSKMISYAKIPEEVRNDTLYFTIWNEGVRAFKVDDIEFFGRERSFKIVNEND